METVTVKALVIYDTVYGNTRQVAEAIAAGLSPQYEVTTIAAAEVHEVAHDIDLLVIGGPTHRHGLSERMHELLERLPGGSLNDVAAAAFDTRYRMPRWMTGSAAVRIARALKHKRAHLTTPPESFFVASEKAPDGKERDHLSEHLEAGEIERARAFGNLIAAQAAPVL